MADLPRYYQSHGVVSFSGFAKALLFTIVSTGLMAWLFVQLKYAVKSDWLQLLFIFPFALLLCAVNHFAVRVGKFKNRYLGIFWSIIIIVWGIYASLIFRVVKLHPQHVWAFLPGPVWSSLKEAFAQGIKVFIRFSYNLEPGVHFQTDPTATVVLESSLVGAIVFFVAVASSREEFFCEGCNSFLDKRGERSDIRIPEEKEALYRSVEGGDISGLLALSAAPEERLRLKIKLFRCDEKHDGILTIAELIRMRGMGRRPSADREKMAVPGLYITPEQCDLIEAYIKQGRKNK